MVMDLHAEGGSHQQGPLVAVNLEMATGRGHENHTGFNVVAVAGFANGHGAGGIQLPDEVQAHPFRRAPGSPLLLREVLHHQRSRRISREVPQEPLDGLGASR